MEFPEKVQKEWQKHLQIIDAAAKENDKKKIEEELQRWEKESALRHYQEDNKLGKTITLSTVLMGLAFVILISNLLASAFLIVYVSEWFSISLFTGIILSYYLFWDGFKSLARPPQKVSNSKEIEDALKDNKFFLLACKITGYSL